MKRLLILTTILFASFAALGQEAATDPVVITAGDVRVHASEIEAAIVSLPPEYQGYASGPGKRAFAQDYLRMKLLAASARKHELEADPIVKAQIDLVVENTLASAELDRIKESISIGDEELTKLYEERADTFEEASARHILIAFEGSPAAPKGQEPLSEEAAKAKAEAIRERLIAGADFGELAASESHDLGSGQRGGNLGSFGRNTMVPEFETVVFDGPVGEIGPVVRTQFGYHIIEVLTRRVKPLEEVRDELEESLRQEKIQAAIVGLEETSDVQFDEAYFGPEAPIVETPDNGGES